MKTNKSDSIRLLFLVQLPPPQHGVTKMNEYVLANPYWETGYVKKCIPMEFGQTLTNVGKVSFGKLFKLMEWMFRVIVALISYKPEVTYFTLTPTGRMFYRDALIVFFLKLSDTKIIFHLHGKGIKDGAEKSRAKEMIYRWVFKKTNIICLSESLTHDIAKVYDGIPFVLANGIKRKGTDGQRLVENPVPVILYLSNLVKNKGIKVFLNALSLIHKKGASFKALIVGGEADFTISEINDFLVSNDLVNRVEVLGPLYDVSKESILKQSDIFVLPSFSEAFPLSILEAMENGLAIIATATGGIPDMFADKIEGLLIPIKDPDSLSEKLTFLLENPALRKEIGKAARTRFINEYGIDNFYTGLNEIFKVVIERN